MRHLEVALLRGRLIAASAAAVLLVPALMPAQAKPDEGGVTVPESARPPEGMCRVWLPDVPERQQPAPTDCASALRNRPRNSILLFGDLSREAKQPPRRETAPGRATVFDDAILRRGLRSSERAGAARMSTMTPTQAAEAAARAGEKAEPAAVKAEASKAAVKRPDPPPPPQ